MLFNSLTFLIFAACFFSVWPVVRQRNWSRWLFLVSASFLFYGWWDWRFLLLITASGLLDFAAGLGMIRFPKQRPLLLGLSVAGNLGTLAAFKYLSFICTGINDVADALEWGPAVPVLQLTLPVGISFYTFQSMSYTIDIYRGTLRPTRNLLHFFAYLAMFPQLVAGPIVRARHLLPQLAHGGPTTERQRWVGLQRVATGYFKKVVIADNIAPAVNLAFASEVPLESGAYWWTISALFAVQIYCDFSGYSDIARGLAGWMGYDFPRNFNHPYLATSMRDFWNRWHISLSTWFRDYVYIPLGGSRGGPLAAYRNAWVVMLVSGLWHGAAWTFVLWGAVHALLLSLERWTRWPERLHVLPGGRILAAGIVLMQVCVAWICFRADSMAQAWAIVQLMFNPAHWNPAAVAGIREVALLMLAITAIMELFSVVHRHPVSALLRRPAPWQPALWAGVLSLCVYLRGPGAAFLYFQF